MKWCPYPDIFKRMSNALRLSKTYATRKAEADKQKHKRRYCNLDACEAAPVNRPKKNRRDEDLKVCSSSDRPACERAQRRCP